MKIQNAFTLGLVATLGVGVGLLILGAVVSLATILTYIALGTGGTDAAPLVRRVMATHFAGS